MQGPIKLLLFAVIGTLGCHGVIDDLPPEDNGPTIEPRPPTQAELEDPTVCEPLNKRVLRLAPRQLDATINSIVTELDFAPSDDIIGSYQVSTRYVGGIGLSMTTPHVGDLMSVIEKVSEQLATELRSWVNCAIAEEDCLEELVAELLRQAFRRPATDEEITRFAAFFHSQRSQYNGTTSLRLLSQAVLMSPHTQFRTEAGEAGSDELTLFEQASIISYSITDGPPDDELWTAAEDGSLADPATRIEHAQRLLASRSTASGIRRFLMEYMKADNILNTIHSTELFPELTPALRQQMHDEYRITAEHIVWDDEGTFEQLVSAPYTFANKSLATHYGIEEPAGETFEQVSTEGQRNGILNQGVYLLQHTRSDSTSIVMRGVSVIEDFLCGHLPSPPADVDDELPVELDSGPTTQRQRLDVHRVGSCAGCHAEIDPMGFAFEQFDAIGRERDTEQGLPIDTTSELVLDGETHQSANVEDLVTIISQSKRARTCFARHVMLFMDGEERSSKCINNKVDAPLRDIVTELVGHENFSTRVSEEN